MRIRVTASGRLDRIVDFDGDDSATITYIYPAKEHKDNYVEEGITRKALNALLLRWIEEGFTVKKI